MIEKQFARIRREYKPLRWWKILLGVYMPTRELWS